MNAKTTSIVSYITIIGWLVAYFAGDKEAAKFHLNQSLVINIASLINGWVLSWILAFIPIVGPIVSWIISIFILVVWIIGLIAAIKQEEKIVPILGNITLLK